MGEPASHQVFIGVLWLLFYCIKIGINIFQQFAQLILLYMFIRYSLDRSEVERILWIETLEKKLMIHGDGLKILRRHLGQSLKM